MKEYDIVNTISNIIGKDFIGDDCAYLKDLGIVVSQDNLVEHIHFNMNWTTPYKLGYKSIAVNISDILASGGKPEYVTIGLSLPNNIDSNFVEQFYLGAESALHGAKIIGGDVTGSKNDIVVSVTVIGTAKNRNISSRSYAKEGYIVITKGNYGSSSAGLSELLNNGKNKALINAHLEPKLDYIFSEQIGINVTQQYAMMDTSDGLADALFKIAEASNVKIYVNYDKIPHLPVVNKTQVLFGGEDYNLVAAIPIEYLSYISNPVIIGMVLPFDGIRLDISGECYSKYEELNTFNHFE